MGLFRYAHECDGADLPSVFHPLVRPCVACHGSVRDLQKKRILGILYFFSEKFLKKD